MYDFILICCRILAHLSGCPMEDERLQSLADVFDGIVILDQQRGLLGALEMEVTVLEKNRSPRVLLRFVNRTDEELWWNAMDGVGRSTRWGIEFEKRGVWGSRGGGGHGRLWDTRAQWEDQLLWSMLPGEERLLVREWDLNTISREEFAWGADPKRTWTLNLSMALPLREPPKWRRKSWMSSEIQVTAEHPGKFVAIQVDQAVWESEGTHE